MMSFRTLTLLVSQCILSYTASAVPLSSTHDPYNGTSNDIGLTEWSPKTLTARADREYGPSCLKNSTDVKSLVPVPLLRIMPLGASITQGIGSSPENGYRKVCDNRSYFNVSLSSITAPQRRVKVSRVPCQHDWLRLQREHE